MRTSQDESPSACLSGVEERRRRRPERRRHRERWPLPQVSQPWDLAFVRLTCCREQRFGSWGGRGSRDAGSSEPGANKRHETQHPSTSEELSPARCLAPIMLSSPVRRWHGLVLLLLVPLVVQHISAARAVRSAWGGCNNDGPFADRLWCDLRLSHAARAQALIDALTPDEKWTLLSSVAGAVPRLGLPPYNWWGEGLHGVARAGIATSFPQVVGLASSFNSSLFRSVGRVIGIEVC